MLDFAQKRGASRMEAVHVELPHGADPGAYGRSSLLCHAEHGHDSVGFVPKSARPRSGPRLARRD
eukprot:7172335-Pyramimonas_sp.AAC.1